MHSSQKKKNGIRCELCFRDSRIKQVQKINDVANVETDNEKYDIEI